MLGVALRPHLRLFLGCGDNSRVRVCFYTYVCILGGTLRFRHFLLHFLLSAPTLLLYVLGPPLSATFPDDLESTEWLEAS